MEELELKQIETNGQLLQLQQQRELQGRTTNAEKTGKASENDNKAVKDTEKLLGRTDRERGMRGRLQIFFCVFWLFIRVRPMCVFDRLTPRSHTLKLRP